MCTRLSIAAIVGLLALAGCGAEEERPVADKAFGETSAEDRERIQEFSRRSRQFSVANATVVSALSRGRVAPARTAYDDMARALEDAREPVDAMENAKLRDRLTRYLDVAEDYGDEMDRWLAYFEAPGPADRATEARLEDDLVSAARAMRREDRAMLTTLLDVASPEEREELRELVQRERRKLEQQAAP